MFPLPVQIYNLGLIMYILVILFSYEVAFSILYIPSVHAAGNNSEGITTQDNAMNSKMLEYLVPGLVAAGASIAAAIIAASNQTKLKKLEEAKAEQDARRDYEYEARKRIYHELEPLIFLHVEDSDKAYNHIQELANMARLGTLSANLTIPFQDNYYFKATIYKLIRPMAVFALMQQRLTSYDLQLEDYFRAQYILAKCLYFSCTDDYYVALGGKNKEDWEYCLLCLFPGELKHPNEEKEKSIHPNHIVYNLLGMTQGVVDSLANSLINNRENRVLTFDEFEKKHFDKNVKMTASMQSMCELISKMNLNTEGYNARYVLLWRILVLHACIYRVMKVIKGTKQPHQQGIHNTIDREEIKEKIHDFLDKEATKFYWVLDSDKCAPEKQKQMDDSFKNSLIAIGKYLDDWLQSNYENSEKRNRKQNSFFRLSKI